MHRNDGKFEVRYQLFNHGSNKAHGLGRTVCMVVNGSSGSLGEGCCMAVNGSSGSLGEGCVAWL